MVLCVQRSVTRARFRGDAGLSAGCRDRRQAGVFHHGGQERQLYWLAGRDFSPAAGFRGLLFPKNVEQVGFATDVECSVGGECDAFGLGDVGAESGMAGSEGESGDFFAFWGTFYDAA